MEVDSLRIDLVNHFYGAIARIVQVKQYQQYLQVPPFLWLHCFQFSSGTSCASSTEWSEESNGKSPGSTLPSIETDDAE